MSSDMIAEQLVGIYLNKAGRVNAQFTRQLRKVSTEIREKTLAIIAARKLPHYEFKPSKPTRRVQEQKFTITSVMIRELLAEVKEERANIADRLKILDGVDRYYLEKLRIMETNHSEEGGMLERLVEHCPS
jgi:hypothetical protein